MSWCTRYVNLNYYAPLQRCMCCLRLVGKVVVCALAMVMFYDSHRGFVSIVGQLSTN
jgi:hypothetical protein